MPLSCARYGDRPRHPAPHLDEGPEPLGADHRGSAERIWEDTANAPLTEYPADRIIERQIEGYHEDRLLFLRNRERLQLLVRFHGAIRNPTFYWEADHLSGGRISGHYEATVSHRETGTFECKRPGS